VLFCHHFVRVCPTTTSGVAVGLDRYVFDMVRSARTTATPVRLAFAESARPVDEVRKAMVAMVAEARSATV